MLASTQELTDRQKRDFKRQGFLVLPGGVDRSLALDARSEIVDAIEEDPDDYEQLKKGSGEMADIEDLEPFEEINERLFDYGEQLVGEGVLESISGTGQLALRYPTDETPPWSPEAEQVRELRSHIDGHGSSYRRGNRPSYNTCFAMMYLDRVAPQGGGFTVWPGSHLDVNNFYEDHPWTADYMGIPGINDDGSWDYSQERSDQFDGFEIHGEPGTVILGHFRLEHTAGVNTSRRIRMLMIHRLRRQDGDEIAKDAAGNLWKYWPAMQDVSLD